MAGDEAATPTPGTCLNREYRGPSGHTARELVRVTEGSAVELLERLQSVKHGISDAREIHRIAIDSVTLLVAVAVPLLHALSSAGLASESSGESVETAQHHLEPNTPSTAAAPCCSSVAGAEVTVSP